MNEANGTRVICDYTGPGNEWSGRHYPWSDDCDLPEQPVVADRIIVNDQRVEASALAALILDHTRRMAEAA